MILGKSADISTRVQNRDFELIIMDNKAPVCWSHQCVWVGKFLPCDSLNIDTRVNWSLRTQLGYLLWTNMCQHTFKQKCVIPTFIWPPGKRPSTSLATLISKASVWSPQIHRQIRFKKTVVVTILTRDANQSKSLWKCLDVCLKAATRKTIHADLTEQIYCAFKHMMKIVSV